MLVTLLGKLVNLEGNFPSYLDYCCTSFFKMNKMPSYFDFVFLSQEGNVDLRRWWTLKIALQRGRSSIEVESIPCCNR